MNVKKYEEKEFSFTVRVPDDFNHEDVTRINDMFASLLKKYDCELLKTSERTRDSENKDIFVLTAIRQNDVELFDSRVIGVSENPEMLNKLMFERIEEDDKNFELAVGGENVKLPFDPDLGVAVYSTEYETCFVSYEIHKYPLIPSIDFEKNQDMNEKKAIACTFISVWDGGYEVSSSAKFDPVTKTVFDIEIADLPEEVLNELEILEGEYMELDGKRFLLNEGLDNDAYVLVDDVYEQKNDMKPLDEQIANAIKNKNKKMPGDDGEPPAYHERF